MVSGSQAPDSIGTMTAGGYSLTLSNELLPTGTAVSVTATLLLDGQPAGGVTLEVGFGTEFGQFTTDASGVATLTFTTPGDRVVIPIMSANSLFGWLYVVPDGYGVVVAQPPADSTGNPVGPYTGQLAMENGNAYTYGESWGPMKAILPEGTAYLEWTSPGVAPEPSLYLYQPVTVVAGAKSEVSLTTAGTALLTVNAAVESTAVAGEVFLHNGALPMDSYNENGAGLTGQIRVTPGAYSVVVKSEDPSLPVLLARTGVAVTQDQTVSFAESFSGLASLQWYGFDGNGVSPTFWDPMLRLGGIRLPAAQGLNYWVTAGQTYESRGGHFTLTAADQTTWGYSLNPVERDPVTPAAGEAVVIATGGQAQARVIPLACFEPGCYQEVTTKLVTYHGDGMWIRQGGAQVQGTLALKDSTGNTLNTWSVPTWPFFIKMSMPATPGSYTFEATYDTGPYNGVVTGRATVVVPQPANYAFAFPGGRLFRPDTPVSLPVTLTNNGLPVSGAQIRVGYGPLGSASTDASGTATVNFTAPSYRDFLPVEAFVNGDLVLEGYVYAVPEGYGVVEVADITFPSGFPAKWYDAGFYSFESNGGTWGFGYWPKLPGAVMPVGTTHVEVAGRNGSEAAYHYQTVTVPDSAVLQVTVHTNDLVKVEASLTIDGQAIPAGLLLHNQALPNDSILYYDHSLPAGNTWATPGTYTLLLKSEDAAGGALIQSTGVTLPGTGPIALNLASAGLGTLHLAGTDGQTNPVDFDTQLTVGPFRIYVYGNDSYRITPGVSVDSDDYNLSLSATDSWRYNFGSQRQPLTLSAGAEATVRLGGPVSAQVEPMSSACLEPGCTARFRLSLQNAGGDHLYSIRRNNATVYGTLALKTLDGTVLASKPVSPGDWDASLDLPSDALGDYKVTVTYDLGPYQGTVENSITVTVAPPPNYSLSLETEVFLTGAPVETTVTLLSNGAPVQGATLQLGYGGEYGSITTDAGGQALISFFAPRWSRSIPIYLVEGSERIRVGEAYAVEPGYGVVQVERPLGPGGVPVSGDYAVHISDGWITSYDNNGNPRLIATAGANQVEVASASGDGLYLYLPITVPDVAKAILTPTVAGTVRLTATATLDGQDIGGELALHHEALRGPSPAWMGWLPRNPWVTPGHYTMAIRGEVAQALIAGQQFDVSADSNVTLSATSSQVATLDLKVTDAGGSPIKADVALDMPNMTRWIPAQAYAVLPGFSYRPARASFSILDANDQWYDYSMELFGHTAVTPQPGQQVQFNIGGPVAPRLKKWNGCDGLGCSVGFETGLYTAKERLTPHYWGSDPRGTLTVTDSLGNTILSRDADPHNGYDEITFPSDKEDTYGVTLSYETGPYGGTVTTSGQVVVLDLSKYTVALSQEVLPALTTGVTVIASVSRDGAAVSDMALDIGYNGGYGTVVTDADGKATITLDTGYREIVPLLFAQTWRVAAELFVVPPGDAVITLDGVTDRDGNPLLNGYSAHFMYVHPEGGGSSWTYSDVTGPTSAIQPAGVNYMEVGGINPGDGKGLFLYRSVDLPAGERTRITLSSAGTVQLTAAVTLDGALVDGQIALHNTAIEAPRWVYSSDFLPATSYVTPGVYNVAVKAGNPRMLLLRSNEKVIAATTLALNETAAVLGRLSLTGLNGYGSSMSFRGTVVVGGFRVGELDTGGSPWFVTPGIPYVRGDAYKGFWISSYWWSYSVWRDGPAVTPAPGQTQALTWGGPVSGRLSQPEPCGGPGCTAIFYPYLETDNGQMFSVWTQSPGAHMSAALKDSTGTVVWSSGKLPLPTWELKVQVPDITQTYTLDVTWSLGNYQAPVTASAAVWAGITVDGYVSAEARAPGYPVTIELLDAQNQAITAPIAPDGHFSFIGVEDGQYILRAEAPGHKMVEVPVTVAGGQVTVPGNAINIVLPFGDLNGDGVIGNTDIVIMMGHYSEYGSASDPAFAKMDVNGDGRIDLHDLVWLFRNISP